MKASDVSFDNMRKIACSMPDLGRLISFIQIEFGLKELESHWQGFVDVSDNYDLTFTTKRRVCRDFYEILSEFVELTESAFDAVG